MKGALTIGGIVTVLFIAMLFALLSLVVIQQYVPANSPTLNGIYAINQSDRTLLITGSNTGNSIGGSLNSTVYGSSGLGASFANLLGYAFIFPAILQFAKLVALMPPLLLNDLNSLFTASGLFVNSGLTFIPIIITGICTSYFVFFLCIVWVSSWQKKNLWSPEY